MNEELAYKRKREVDKLYDWLWNMAAPEVSVREGLIDLAYEMWDATDGKIMEVI